MKIVRERAAVLLVAMGLLACGDDEKTSTQAASTCSAARIEADLDVDPFVGPAVDASGKLVLAPGTNYIVSSTYAQPISGPDGAPVTARYQEVFGAVAEQLQKEPGLLAFTLGSSDACGSGRTLAVWKSEADMYSFVTSDAHTTAMREVQQLLLPSYRVTHWSIGSAEQATFAEAGRQLAAERQ
ncbi:MAG: hypothetical protein JWN04_196 [Myxococcaceae bacterium]|nr:hypothetical protein [Myxococcaceae bacterium]